MKPSLDLILMRIWKGLSSVIAPWLLTPLLLLSPAATTGYAQSESPVTESSTPESSTPESPTINQPSSTGQPSLLEQLRAAQPATITDIQLVEIEDGLKVILMTEQPERIEVFQVQEGTTLVVDITNARMVLEGENQYQQTNPIPGVSLVTVEQRGQDIQMTVVSEGEMPPVAYFERLLESLQLDVVTVAPGETDSDIEFGDNTLRIIVSAAPLDGYVVPNASVGTRTDTPVIDVPQAIQVIPEEVLEDQDAQTLNEALRNVSGVSAGRATSGTRSATPIIRGFENNNNILRNGIRDDTLQFGSALPNIERIEILKGPASVLFGAGDLGGSINLVTESPLYDPRYEFEMTAGSFDRYRGVLDFSGPLDDDSQLAYRVNLSYEDNGSFIDFEESEFFFVSPSLQVVNTDDTSLIFDLEYLKSLSRGTSSGLPAISAIGLENNSFIDTLVEGGLVISDELRESAGTLDISSNLGEPSITEGSVFITRVGYRLSHELNESWKINNDFLASFQETPDETFVVGTGFVQQAGQPNFDLLSRIYLSNPSDRQSYAFNANVVGEFDVLGIDQTLLLGTEVSLEKERDIIVQRLPSPFLSFNPLVPATPFSITELNYDPATFFNDLNRDRIGTDSVANRNRYGFYAQTQLDFSDNFIALLGGRLDIVDQDFQDFVNPNPDPIELNETAFSPRIGLVYKPASNVSLYASYSQSFNPVLGRSFEDEVFEPERGRQFETGIKASFMNDKLFTTLAYYDLTRSNVLTQDPINTGFQVQVGEQKSSGIEFDLAGEILPGWSIIANYANTDAVVSEDNEIEVGTRLINSPRNAASLWTTYQLQSGNLKGLGIGLGVTYVGDRNGEIRRPFRLPAYTRADASIFYEKDRFRTQVNFENLFNTRYFESARDQFRVQPGSPFAVSASVNWTF
ncbi:MAG: TonB-dependent siderophore receptor [Cyanobacteria bacterium P01_D01_bin.105]